MRRSTRFHVAGLVFAAAALSLAAATGQEPPGTGFNGLDMTLGNLSRLSSAQSRSISPENFTGEKGKAGMAVEGTGQNAARELGQGWKISPSVRIKAGATFTLAEINGSGAIQQIWMTPAPLDKTRHNILRFYWDDEAEPSVEAPLGDFFACGWGKYAQVSSLAVFLHCLFEIAPRSLQVSQAIFQVTEIPQLAGLSMSKLSFFEKFEGGFEMDPRLRYITTRLIQFPEMPEALSHFLIKANMPCDVESLLKTLFCLD